MALGNVFVRPQLLERDHSSEELRIFNDLIELASLLLRDALQEGSVKEVVGSILQQCIDKLKQEVEGRLRNSRAKVLAWFQPAIDRIKTGVSGIDGNFDSGSGVVAVLSAIVKLISETLKSLTADQLAQRLNELAEIVEKDLGLTPERLAGLLKLCMDRAEAELTRDYLSGDASEAARNRFLIGSKLASLNAFLLDQSASVTFFNREKLINDLAEELKKRDWDALLQIISETAGKAGDGVAGLAPLFSLGGSNGKSAAARRNNNPNGDGPGSHTSRQLKTGSNGNDAAPGSSPPLNSGAPDPMSWYASWFLGSRFTSDFVGVQDRFNLEKEPFFNQMSFKEFSPEFMEHWAHLTQGITDLVEALMHGGSIEKGDYVSNLVNLIFQGSKGIFTLAAYGHQDEDWLTAFKIVDNYFFEYGLATLGTFGSSFESYPGSASGWALASLMPDVFEMLLYALWTNHAREFSLSLLTLINADPDNRPESQNHEKAAGFIQAFTELGTWFAAFAPFIIQQRKHYGFPFGSDRGQIALLVGYWALGGVGLSYLFSLAGWGIAGAIAGKTSDNYWGENWWKILLLSALKWPVYWYLMWDRSTDGKFGQDAATDIVTFPGYPDSSTSPYKLPYPKKDALPQCVQSHYGIWSHNAQTTQVYAVDFGHDHGDAVLAMRGGTVAGYHDHIADGSDEDWNIITIKHDDAEEGPLPNPQHDRDHTGVVFTWADYGHGRHFGVRHAFAARGIPEDYIIGSKVKQGNVIMYAGHTGRSAYNHLHVHVRSSLTPRYPYVTVPFVFREVEKSAVFGFIPVGREGVPRTFHFYRSDNEKTGEIEALALHHPDYHRGVTRASGNNFVILDTRASSDDDAYKDAHILVTATRPNGVKFYQYKKIVSYEGGSKKAIIHGNWDSPPPHGSDFRIGAPPYGKAGRFHKQFAYLAGNDTGGAPLDFSDGRKPYQYSLIAAYHRPGHEGRVQDGGALGGNWIALENSASDADDACSGRHILIKRNNAIIQYKKIIAYEGAARKATIEGVWEMSLATGGSGDHYTVGAAPYSRATGREKRYAFLAPDTPTGKHSPGDFGDRRKPYAYLTFKLNWP